MRLTQRITLVIPQALLESKADEAITREDYLAVARRLERDVCALAQRGVMWNAVVRPLDAFMISFDLDARHHTRLHSIAKQLQRKLFRGAALGGGGADAPPPPPRPVETLADLKIEPVDERIPFDPETDNIKRRNGTRVGTPAR